MSPIQIIGTLEPSAIDRSLLNPQIPVESEVIHMRVLNASNIGYLSLRVPSMIAGDQVVSDPGPKEHVIMGPGDRIETEWTVGPDPTLSTQPYAMHGGGAYGDTVELASLIPPNPVGTRRPNLAIAPRGPVTTEHPTSCVSGG